MEALRNPVSDIRKPKQPSGRDRRLQTGEEKELLDKASPQLRPLITLALETAMRQGELLSICWKDVNLNNRTIFLQDSKNGESRTVPLSSTAVATLKKIPRDISTPHVFPILGVSRKFSLACKAAEIEDLRFHDLRHEATSRLFEKGLNPMEVASITGLFGDNYPVRSRDNYRGRLSATPDKLLLETQRRSTCLVNTSLKDRKFSICNLVNLV
jgi:integrase